MSEKNIETLEKIRAALKEGGYTELEADLSQKRSDPDYGGTCVRLTLQAIRKPKDG